MAIETVKVVVPTFNRLPQVERLLSGLAHQAEFAPPIEMVDDGSTDGTGAWSSSVVSAPADRPVHVAVAPRAEVGRRLGRPGVIGHTTQYAAEPGGLS